MLRLLIIFSNKSQYVCYGKKYFYNLMKRLKFKQFSLIILVILYFSPLGVAQQFHGKKSITLSLPEAISLALINNTAIDFAFRDRIVQKFQLEIEEGKFTPKASVNALINRSEFLYSTNSSSSKNSNFTTTVTEKLPTGANIDLELGTNENRFGDSDGEPADSARNTDWNVTFSQPLLKGAGIDVNTSSVKIARIQEKINMNSLKTTVTKTITEVILAYRAYYLALSQQKISRDSFDQNSNLIEINEALIEAGRMPRIELIQSQVEMSSNQFDLASTENMVDEMRLALINFLNIEKSTEIDLPETVEFEKIELSEEECIDLAIKNNPDYLNALFDLEISRLNLMLAKNEQLWDISVGGGYGENYTRDGYLDNNKEHNWTVGLALSFSLGDKSSREGYMSAKINLDKQEIELRELHESIENKIHDALRNIDMKDQMNNIAEKLISLSTKQLEAEKEKMKAGRSTNFQVISFQHSLKEAQNNRLNVMVDYSNAVTELEAFLGVTLDKWKIPLAERYRSETYNW